MFSRDELLGGLPARRASTILFAIEATAARLVAASRINRATYVGERTSAEREQAFLQALSRGKELPRSPTIFELERFAAGWADLVPEAPDVRAAIGRLIGQKYRFRRSDVAGLRAALGFDDSGVAAAFERLHGKPIDSIYTDRLPMRQRLRWRLSALAGRFDRLPPVWIAYFLALTEALGEGFLSLPLALAGLGPLPGVLLLIGFGVINLITVGAMTEAVIRNGSMRYGTSYISRLVSQLLGRVPASTLGVIFAVDGVIAFWFYFLGFGSVLAGGTGIPMGVWLVVLLLINVVILRNETLDDTIASAVVIGTTTLILAVAITAIALLNVNPANVAYINVPLLNGRPLEAATVGLVFGVILMAFFGHTSAANSAKLLLTLEPSGRALMRGNLAAMVTVIAVYCVASVAILGVLGPTPLTNTTGTALTPLADSLGPVVSFLCLAYTLLAIGIGSLYVTLGTYNQVVELLPRNADHGIVGRIASTRRGRAILGFAPAVLVCLALEVVVYLGVDDFAGAISLGGTLTVPIITGIFPMLLVWAARRKGEYVPAGLIRLLGHRITIVTILAIYLVAVLAHVFIWQHPIERIAALVATLIGLGLIAWVLRNGSLRPRAVVELRVDQRTHRTTYSVTTAGESVVLDGPVPISDRHDVAATVAVPAGAWRELRVWPHEVSASGWSTGLAAQLRVNGEGPTNVAADGPGLLAVDGQPLILQLRLQGQEGHG
jgi:hypothetical protein